MLGCSYGHYWDPAVDSCFVCPIGTYSDTFDTEESCTSCPEGQTTSGGGSNGLNACRSCKKIPILNFF